MKCKKGVWENQIVAESDNMVNKTEESEKNENEPSAKKQKMSEEERNNIRLGKNMCVRTKNLP